MPWMATPISVSGLNEMSPHKHQACSVTISLKGYGDTPGDTASDQMRAIADLAERFAHDELRISHEQNIVLPHVAQADLHIYRTLKSIGFGDCCFSLISTLSPVPVWTTHWRP